MLFSQDLSETEKIAVKMEKNRKLLELRKNLDWLKTNIERSRAKLVEKDIALSKKDLVIELNELKEKYLLSQQNFIEEATGVHIRLAPVKEAPAKRDILEEVQNLLGPMIDGLRRVSERPRKIEALKTNLENLKQELEKVKQADRKLTKLYEDGGFKRLKKDFKEYTRVLGTKAQGLEFEISAARRELDRLTGTKKSFIEEATKVVASFLSTKGKNLLLSMLTFILLLWGMYIIRKKLFSLDFLTKKLAVYTKPLMALYTIIAFFTATIGGILCLYVLNDWVLVTFAILIISGILWSLKQFIPQFIEEMRLVLNLSTVREGERIVWKGLPWKVEKLGFYSRLINEDLGGGELRIAAKDLIGIYSRPIPKGEPWFPTHQGDWVVIGSIHGKVLSQTPDQVIVKTLGGSELFYSTVDFLSSGVNNLMKGFRIEENLGLDYGVQGKVTEHWVEIFKLEFKKRIDERYGADNFRHIDVQFSEAAGSSLNLWFCLDCKKELAQQYYALKRSMHKIFVDICNDQNLEIPFNQLTVHLPDQKQIN